MPITNSEFMAHLMEHANQVYTYIDHKIPKKIRSQLGTDDILQEVWLAAFRHFQKSNEPDLFKDKESILRWLLRTSERKLIDVIRKINTKKRGGDRRIISSQAKHTTSYYDLLNAIRSDGRTPSSEVSAKEAMYSIQLALCNLPDDQRKAVTMRHIYGQKKEIIATEMDRSIPAVRGLIQRGMFKLRDLVGSSGSYFNDLDSQTDQHPPPKRKAQ